MVANFFALCGYLYQGFITLLCMAVNKVNLLTTDDKCTCHVNLAACYQLVKSISKMGFALGSGWDRGGWAGIVTSALHMAAVLPGCRKVLVDIGRAFSLLFDTNGHRTTPLPLSGLHFWHCRQLLGGRNIPWLERVDHCKLTNEWLWPSETSGELTEPLAHVSTARSRSGNTDNAQYPLCTVLIYSHSHCA